MMETLPAGTMLRGRYRIERPLGSGGFGHVYLALDEQTRKQFAVKEYLVTGPNGKIQLEHEAHVLSQLHHPSLPAFQDAFDERGRYYIVLGYIEGNDLTDCLRITRQKNETLPYERILTWLISICDAVSFLHNHHPPVIHRDIKPDNIRITPGGAAILVDLGNAKATEDGARTLFFIRHQGTPGYAPLEQYPGGTGTDARSDVYALGGTLYFALTAHEPPSVSARNTSITQGAPDLPTLREILAQNPPETSGDQNAGRQFRLGITKPSRPAPRHSRHIAQLATLPPELLDLLDAIIHRAMAMRPKDRYQSVADMTRDLRQAIAMLPSNRPPSAPQERPFDPHSTQPDLQFLVDSWQSNQATPPPENTMRCPRCQAELPKSATFCSQCGLPLGKQSPRNSQQQGGTPLLQQNNTTRAGNAPNLRPNSKSNLQDTSAEPTLIYNPAQPPTLRRKPTITGSTGTEKPDTSSFAAQPSPRSLKALSAQPVAPRSFLQTTASAAHPALNTTTRPSHQAVPQSQGVAAVPEAFAPISSPSPAFNQRPKQLANTTGRRGTDKYLVYALLAVGVLLLIIILILVAHLDGGHTGITPLHP